MQNFFKSRAPPSLSNRNVALGGNVKRILHDLLQMYTLARTRVYGSACKCMQAVPNPDQSNPSAGRLARLVTLFLAGLHRRFLPHSTRARRWHLRKQFFLSWPECHICPDFLYLLFLFAFALPSSSSSPPLLLLRLVFHLLLDYCHPPFLAFLFFSLSFFFSPPPHFFPPVFSSPFVYPVEIPFRRILYIDVVSSSLVMISPLVRT